MKKNASRIFFLVCIMVIILISNTACAEGLVPVPKGTVAVLAIDKEGKMIPIDLKGERITQCKLITEEKLDLPVCKSLVGGQIVRRGDSVVLFQKSLNPCYKVLFIGGGQFEYEYPPPCY